MRFALIGLFATVAILPNVYPLLAEEPASTDPKGDLESIQGEWLLTAYTLDGVDAPAEVLKKVKVVFAKQQFLLKPMPVYSQNFETKTNSWKAETDFEARFELGKSGEARTFELLPGKAEDGTRLKGIYSLGDEGLKICFSFGDGPPTKFESKAGSMNRLLTLKRAKK